jgi:predicted ATPase
VLGEQAYPLAPLALPAASSADGTGLARDIEQVGASAASPAVALFLARAQAHQPHLPLTAENLAAVVAICERLDGLPLAIELAAAHVKVLPPPAMLQRLERRLSLLVGGARDVEARQQTMRATLAWSEDLLQPAERRLFQRLSVFAGSFTLAAAEAVCAAPADAESLGLDVLEGLERLVDQSLVAPWHAKEQAAEGEPRFRLLYVIRDYAQERLRERGEAEALQQAHAAYYVAFMDQWRAAISAAALAPQGWVAMRALVDQLQPEQDNLRAALTWLCACAEAPQSRQRQRVGDTGGHTDQQAGVRLAAAVASPIMQGLSLAGNLLWPWSFDGYLSEGRAWLGTFLALDTLSSSWESAVGAEYEGRKGRKSREAQEYQEANVISAMLVRARALYAAGVLAYWQGDIDRVVPLLERSLALLRTLDDRLMLGLVLNNLGLACGHQGDLEKARAYFEESLALGRALGFGLHVVNVLGSLSELALAAGDLGRASIVSEEALTESRRAQNAMNGSQALRVQVIIAWRQGRLSQAAALAKEALTLTLETRDVRFYADSLDVCAIVCAAKGQVELAARWLGASVTYRERIGMPRRMEAPTADDIEAAIAPARAALGEAAWAAAFTAGQALSLNEALSDALNNVE